MFVYEFLSLVIAPLLVGLVLELVSHWLEEKDDN
nr:type I toxin-antitoxin system Fst family toxin [Enterococcus faecalis]